MAEIGVIGSGTMGAGIAESAALARMSTISKPPRLPCYRPPAGATPHGVWWCSPKSIKPLFLRPLISSKRKPATRTNTSLPMMLPTARGTYHSVTPDLSFG